MIVNVKTIELTKSEKFYHFIITRDDGVRDEVVMSADELNVAVRQLRGEKMSLAIVDVAIYAQFYPRGCTITTVHTYLNDYERGKMEQHYYTFPGGEVAAILSDGYPALVDESYTDGWKQRYAPKVEILSEITSASYAGSFQKCLTHLRNTAENYSDGQTVYIELHTGYSTPSGFPEVVFSIHDNEYTYSRGGIYPHGDAIAPQYQIHT